MQREEQRTYLTYLLPAIVVIVAALLRVAYLAEIIHEPSFSHPIYDPEYNAHWARGVATGDWTPPVGVNDPEITTTPHGRPPGYPWFLAVIYILFGVNDYAPRLVQMALGIINALLLYHIGRRLFGLATGFVAGLFMATYWVFPYFEGILTYPAVAVFILLCLILTLEKWAASLQGQPPSLHLSAAAGALLGCFALLRPNVLLFAPALALWMSWILLRERVSYGRVFFSLLALSLGCVVVLAPAFIRNKFVANDFVFISAYGGINLYVGNHPEASLVEPQIPELMELAGIDNWTCFDYPAIVRGIAAKQGKDKITFSEANRYFYHKAFSFLYERPGTFLKNMLRKGVLFWGPYEITNDTVMEYDKRFSRTLRWLPGFAWCAALFVFGSCLALWDMRSRQSQKHVNTMIILLWLYTGAYFLSVIIYFVAGRYRVPVIPVLLLFGAAGVVRLISAVKDKDLRRAAIGLGALATLLLLFHLNPTGYIPRQSTWHLRAAMAYTAAGDDTKAEGEYRKALALGASSSVVYANLGRLHINRGQREEGIALYRDGLLLNPNNPVIHNNLGYELYQTGDVDAAAHHFDQAATVNPRFALAHINLGNALIDQGDLERALFHFHTAMKIMPGNAAIPYNIARIHFAQGDYQGALTYYEKALTLRPEFAEALNNIGYLHATQGDHAVAIHWYRQAIAVAPDFLLAYNNLGNALFEAGDIDGAADAYQQALQQKENDIFAQFNMGRIFMARKDWNAATSRLEQVLSIQQGLPPYSGLSLTEYARALALLGAARLENNLSEAAVAALEQAAALLPNEPELCRLLAEAQKRLGKYKAALEIYDAVLNDLFQFQRFDIRLPKSL